MHIRAILGRSSRVEEERGSSDRALQSRKDREEREEDERC